MTHVYLFFLFLSGCFPKKEVVVEPPCVLSPGVYGIQSLSHDPDSGVYYSYLLGAPACLKMPFELKAAELLRSEDQQKEKAVLDWPGEGVMAKISMKSDFSIAIVQKNGKTGELQQTASSWEPFLAGAAGAAVGSAIGAAAGQALMGGGRQKSPVYAHPSSVPQTGEHSRPGATPPPPSVYRPSQGGPSTYGRGKTPYTPAKKSMMIPRSSGRSSWKRR